jgi:hypothetical protein
METWNIIVALHITSGTYYVLHNFMTHQLHEAESFLMS